MSIALFKRSSGKETSASLVGSATITLPRSSLQPAIESLSMQPPRARQFYGSESLEAP
jgi:hypothetical protein